MRRRAWAALHVVALASAGACTALIGGTDVPNPVDGGIGEAEAGRGADARHPRDAGPDERAKTDVADGAKEACANACTAGATRCQDGGVETCSTSSDGCTAWGKVVACASSMCSAGTCICAPPGAQQCSDNGVETCNADGGWGTPVACESDQNCDSGTCVTPASCSVTGAGTTNCGSGGSGTQSCCTSLEVPGGTFDRSYDDVTYKDAGALATVSGFRLDRYEVTVGRFRAFVGAVVGGWLPTAGSGKHTHLNGGAGLNATGGGQETGWDAKDWNADLATTQSQWNMNLECDATYETWSPTAGPTDNAPITCETWYEAYAFCIWDGGFLPSEAEWNYAAAGGGGKGGQRAYPWSAPPTQTNADCSLANYAGAEGGVLCVATGANAVGSESPAGDGAFGQADLAGNAWEWMLDDFASSYVNPCPDCVNLTPSTNRVLRGASFNDSKTNLLVSTRYDVTPASRFYNVGVRCARVP